jgi:hypothetical protein
MQNVSPGLRKMSIINGLDLPRLLKLTISNVCLSKHEFVLAAIVHVFLTPSSVAATSTSLGPA